MKLWQLNYYDDEGEFCQGIFSTPDKAKEYIQRLKDEDIKMWGETAEAQWKYRLNNPAFRRPAILTYEEFIAKEKITAEEHWKHKEGRYSIDAIIVDKPNYQPGDPSD